MQIVGGTSGDIVQHQLLCHTAAQQGDNILKHCRLGDIAGVLFGQIHCVAARTAAGDNANLVHRVMVLAEIAGNCVAGLVVGGQAALLIGDNVALLLGAHHNLYRGFLDFLLGNRLLALTCRQQGGLVDKVFQIGA